MTSNNGLRRRTTAISYRVSLAKKSVKLKSSENVIKSDKSTLIISPSPTVHLAHKLEIFVDGRKKEKKIAHK